MACVIALLLASAKMQTLNRMVLVTDKQSDYSYTVIPHVNTLIPAPENTYMSSLPIQYSSTTSAVYCSAIMNSEEIVKSISNSAKEAKEDKDQKNNIDDELQLNEIKCFENIKAVAKKTWFRAVHSSQLDQSLCQTKTLIDLFHHGVILPPKKYNKFFPKNGTGATTRIVVDKINIGDIVQDGKIYHHTEWDANLSALAWYQGNLHIFKIGKHGWYPLTKIGNEALNGPMIYLFMLGTSTKPWNSKKFRYDEVESGLKVLGESRQITSFNNYLRLSSIPPSSQVKMKLAKLSAISPVGTIGTK
ncbi:unnamed protein product [Blumeria hordei]|uniref:Uncharacterized protein n=2 Tax=Blumeria hordei TaxID=2867405 RepID=A0A383V3P0_BLUHO|nr:CSEP0424 putative effector protein [Blumeria hordei DH14]SZF06112.1 unnamed protein product [Blumeria hordei]